MKQGLGCLIFFGIIGFARLTAAQNFDFIVAKDGSGNFTTVQEAFNAVPDFRKNRTIIFNGKSVFIRCRMGGMIRQEGWHNWNKPDAVKTAFFAEYNNSGPGTEGSRVPWSHKLTSEEAAEYTPAKILGEWFIKDK